MTFLEKNIKICAQIIFYNEGVDERDTNLSNWYNWWYS